MALNTVSGQSNWFRRCSVPHDSRPRACGQPKATLGKLNTANVSHLTSRQATVSCSATHFNASSKDAAFFNHHRGIQHFVKDNSRSPLQNQCKAGRKARTVALLGPFISQAATDKTIQLPINYYQVLQAEKHLMPEKIVRAYEARVRELPGDGAPYSKAALAAREELLLIARNLLTNSDARRSYNVAVQNDDVGLVEVPWAQLPGALALLQEVGEEEVVLEVGRAALAERPPNRVFKQDVVLAMALSLVELARESVDETPPAFAKACEQLERALELLKEEGGKGFATDLQEQIDSSLARLAPYCVLDLLSKPLGPEHAAARKEGLAGVRELLAAMGEPESRWRHPDVMSRAEFAEEAFSRMTAAEQVDLYNERSPDSRDSFPELLSAAKAHIAEGFMQRRPQLVQDADEILTKLSKELQHDPDSSDVQRYDVALERAMSCLLLGRVDEAKVHLGLDTSPPTGNPDIAEFVYTNSSSFTDLLPGLCSLLERWLGESLLVSYREASDVSPAITPYFEDPHVKAYLESLQKGSLGLAIGRIFKEAFRLVTRIVSTPVRAAKWAARGVEELAAGLRRNKTKGPVMVEDATVTAPPEDRELHEARMEAVRERLRQSGGTMEQLRESKGFGGAAIDEDFGGRFGGGNGAGASGGVTEGAALKRGPPVLPLQEKSARGLWESGKLKDLDLEQFTRASEANRLPYELGELASNDGQHEINEVGISGLELVSESASDGEERFDDVVAMKAAQSGAVSAEPPTRKSSSSRNVMLGAALFLCAISVAAMKIPRKVSSKPPVPPPATARTIAPPQPQIIRKPPVEVPPQREAETRMPPMDSVLAEGIIRRWQKAKARALGKRADVSGLRDVLDGGMLAEWTGKAREFAAKGKRWEYDLVGISVESVRVSNRGREAAVEVTLQERATEYDASGQQIESYEDEYRAKYDLKFVRGEGWRIVSGTVLG